MIEISFDDFDCGCIMIYFIYNGQEIRRCDFSLSVDEFTTITNFLEECIKQTHSETVLGEEALSTKLVFDKLNDEDKAILTFTYEDNSSPFQISVETKQFVAEFYKKTLAVLKKELDNFSGKTHYYCQDPVKDYNDCNSTLIEKFIRSNFEF